MALSRTRAPAAMMVFSTLLRQEWQHPNEHSVIENERNIGLRDIPQHLKDNGS
jgi:hypothetical protein